MQSSYSDPVEHNPAHNYITTTHRGDIMSIQSMPSTALYHLSQKWKQLINNFMIIQDISIPATNADITHVSRFLINSFPETRGGHDGLTWAGEEVFGAEGFATDDAERRLRGRRRTENMTIQRLLLFLLTWETWEVEHQTSD